MKRILFFKLSLLFILLLQVQDSVAQDYTQWSLPLGAQARLGKGRISGNIAYSPDGSKLAVASGAGIWIYDARIGIEVALLAGHTGVVRTVSFSQDGNTLASGADDDTILLWDVNTGRQKAAFKARPGYGMRYVWLSPDGASVVSYTASDPLRLWDTVTGQYKLIPVTSRSHPVLGGAAFSPDGAP